MHGISLLLQRMQVCIVAYPDEDCFIIEQLGRKCFKDREQIFFAIIAERRLNFNFPGYLSAQANLPEGRAVNQPEAEATKLGLITLLAGDMNGDNVVDILDLANLAQRYQSTDPTADLNADGIVDILDLALVAGNYQRQGPLTVGQ